MWWIVLLPLVQCVPFAEIVGPAILGSPHQSTSVLPWHRLEECPSDQEHFIHDTDNGEFCRRQLAEGDSVSYKCGGFTQFCFKKTMKIECSGFRRTCNSKELACTEEYDDCTVSNTTSLVPKAPGIPPRVFAECIPGIHGVRDQCRSTMRKATSEWSFNNETDRLTGCNIAIEDFTLNCYNYTRNCISEESSVANDDAGYGTVLIDSEKTSCGFMTLERRPDKHLIWNNTIIGTDEFGEIVRMGSQIVDRIEPHNYTKDESWEACEEATAVPYEPVCNMFIYHLMGPMADVMFDPNGHTIENGISMFLSRWDGGFEILCESDCFMQLIKFSRTCWPGLPLQRFLPGADYETLEVLMRNMTRIACITYPPPLVKNIPEEGLGNAKNSCAIFFQEEHPITKPMMQNISQYCVDGPDMCTENCTTALDTLAARFGCCLGSIVWLFEGSGEWLAHWNFAHHRVITKLEQCGTSLEDRCEILNITSLVVDIVRNLIYLIGGLMTLVVVIMTVSFYWQLEHEPIKKAFYHF